MSVGAPSGTLGLDGESHTLEEIASEIHLAPERVRQIERHAFATLAAKLDG